MLGTPDVAGVNWGSARLALSGQHGFLFQGPERAQVVGDSARLRPHSALVFQA